MSELVFELPDLNATERLGLFLAERYQNKPALLLFSGPIGAGKTTLLRSFIKALLKEDITISSPSYSYLHIYEKNPPIFHFDLYRIEHHNELEELGLLEQIYDPNALRLIEWPERMPELINQADAHIILDFKSKKRTATINFSPFTP